MAVGAALVPLSVFELKALFYEARRGGRTRLYLGVTKLTQLRQTPYVPCF